MSLLHSFLNRTMMKTRVFYDPKQPKDYAAIRAQEVALTARIKPPRGVALRQEPLGGVSAEWVTGEQNPAERIILYIHGGGFVTGSSASRRAFTGYLAGTLGVNVVSIDYRLAPEHPFPAGPEDCLSAYKSLLERYSSDRIVVLGESAGGNLVLSLALQIREAKLPQPAAFFALSPTVQYDRVLDSYRENLDRDCMVTNLSEEVQDVYLCSHEDSTLKKPIAAPYYGDFTGCAPVLLWTSDAEVLRDDSLILFDRLKQQGVTARLYLRRGMMHTWLVIPFFPESKRDLRRLGQDLNAAFAGTLTGADEAVWVDAPRGRRVRVRVGH